MTSAAAPKLQPEISTMTHSMTSTLLTAYLTSQQQVGKSISTSTVRAYKYFFSTCEQQQLPITASDFVTVYIHKARNCQRSTINRYRKQMVLLYSVLFDTGNALDSVRIATCLINAECSALMSVCPVRPSCRALSFTPSEVESLYDICPVGGINRLLLLLLFTTGLRVGGVCNIRVAHIDKRVATTTEKGNTKHEITICRQLRYEIDMHILRLTKKLQCEPVYLFPSNLDVTRKCTTASLQKRFRILCEKVGIKQTNIHRTRHTVAQALRLAGRSEYLIQRFLGHSSVRTTSQYGALHMSQVVCALQLPWMPVDTLYDPCALLYSLCPYEAPSVNRIAPGCTVSGCKIPKLSDGSSGEGRHPVVCYQ